MSGEHTSRRSISSFDCVMTCTVIALSLSRKTIKKMCYKHALVPKQTPFDYWYGFYLVHQHSHNSGGNMACALDSLLNRRYVSYIAQLDAIESTDTRALKSYIDRGFASSPGAVLWSLLTDPRSELQSKGVYHVHQLVFQTVQGKYALHPEAANGSDSLAEQLRVHQEENVALKRQLRELARKSEKTIACVQHERERLSERIAVLEARPSREGHLIRENRTLRYRLAAVEQSRRHDTPETHPVRYTQASPPPDETICPPPDDSPCNYPDVCPLHALKVAVIGGLDRLETRYRQTVERLGGEFMFHRGYCKNGTHVLRNMVCGSDIVVFITSVNSHTAMWTIKAECKKNGKKFTVLKHTSPDALERTLLAEVAG